MCAEYNTVGIAREREIFLSALERLNPSDRAAYLKVACGDDPARRIGLEKLIEEHEGCGEFLAEPAVGAALLDKRTTGGDAKTSKADTDHEAQVTEKPGARIGRYRLLQTIGEGGCGIVYMAE